MKAGEDAGLVALDVQEEEPDGVEAEPRPEVVERTRSAVQGLSPALPAPESSRLAAPALSTGVDARATTPGSSPRAVMTILIWPERPLRSRFLRARTTVAGWGSTPTTVPAVPTAWAATMTCRPKFTPARTAVSPFARLARKKARTSGS
jgi:hypothetical protein